MDAIHCNKRKNTLYVSTISFVVLLTWVYIQKFFQAFQPPRVFDVYSKFFSWWRRAVPTSFQLEPSMKGIQPDSLGDADRKQWTTKLQSSVFHNRICLFVSKKLGQYQASKYNLMAYAFSLLGLVAGTITAFSAIFFAIYNIDKKNFSSPHNPSYFDFFYYSFTNFAHGTSSIVAITFFSKIAYILEVTFEFSLLALLITLYFNVRSVKYDKQIEVAIAELERQSIAMEDFIRQEYEVPSIAEAIAVLEKAEGGSVAWIVAISNSLN